MKWKIMSTKKKKKEEAKEDVEYPPFFNPISKLMLLED